MAQDIDINTLAALSRLELTDDEKKQYATELSGILRYVEQVRELTGKKEHTPSFKETSTKNVLREDKEPHEKHAYTDELMREAPRTKDGFIQVKKIVDNDS